MGLTEEDVKEAVMTAARPLTRVITRDGQDYHPTKGWRGPRQNARKTRQVNRLASEHLDKKVVVTKGRINRWLSIFNSRNRKPAG